MAHQVLPMEANKAPNNPWICPSVDALDINDATPLGASGKFSYALLPDLDSACGEFPDINPCS